MLKLFTISYGFLSVLGWTARKNKNCVSSQRREDPPVGRRLEPEDRGEKTFMDLGRLLPRWAVMTASIESLCFYPQVEGKEFPPTGLNGTNSPSHVLPLAVVLGVYFIFMYWPYLSIYPSVLQYFLHCDLWLICALIHLTDGQDTDMYHQRSPQEKNCQAQTPKAFTSSPTGTNLLLP